MIKKLLYNLYINYSFKKIVMNDKRIKSSNDFGDNNVFLKYSKNLSENGVLELDNSYESSDSLNEINKYCDEKLKENINNNLPVITLSYIHKKNSIVEKILTDPKINFIVKNYLGDDARLDLISLSITQNCSNQSIISEKWHYDNVGKRLKMFFYLNDNNDICTDYVKGTNSVFHKSYSTDGSRLNKKIINKLNDKIISFFPKKNKILFFDTNGYHRGNYKNITNKVSKNILSYRRILKFEFSSSKKSDLFYGKSNTIGVRGTFFSNDFNFIDCKLIDQKYLSKIENNYFFYDKDYKYYNNY